MSSLLRALFNGTSKHKKLSENWATTREPVVEGVTFYCKYLGSTMVDDPKGETTTAEAIKRIIQTAKMTLLKPDKVSLHVSVEGIRVQYTETSATLIHTSIYKISYCSADAHYDHVFAFIATNDNDTCECHAFLCPKRKMAQAVTVSIAQAFNLAYEYWKMAVENKENGEIFAHEELPAEVTVNATSPSDQSKSNNSQPSSQASSPIPIRPDFGSSDMSTSGYQSSTQALLIDLDDSSEKMTEQTKNNEVSTKINKPWDAFDDFSDVSDEFSRLALRAVEEPQHLPGTSPSEWAAPGPVAFLAPLPASQTENTSWPSVSSPSSTSPTASSPTSPWQVGHSPPDFQDDFSRSPNMAFLHSCQSPSNTFDGFNSISNQATACGFPENKPVQNPFISHNNAVISVPLNSTPSNPFCNMNTTIPVNGCGSWQPIWGGRLFDSKNKLICS